MTPKELSELYRRAVKVHSMDSEDVDYALLLEDLDAMTCSAEQAWRAVERHAQAAAGARALERLVRRLQR